MNPTERFSNRAHDYARWRPGYPAELIDAIAYTPGALLADIGAGTGISSELLLRCGFSVVAVEPNSAMREKAHQSLGGNPRFRCVDGTAEATTLQTASVDGVFCAQAFHWFDGLKARDEFLRIVRPGGVIAICWNDRHIAGSAFMRGLEDLLNHHSPEYREKVSVRTQRTIASVKTLFAPRPVQESVFSNSQQFDWDGLAGRLRSASYVPLPGDPAHEPFFAGLRGLYERTQSSGLVLMQYDCFLYRVAA